MTILYNNLNELNSSLADLQTLSSNIRNEIIKIEPNLQIDNNHNFIYKGNNTLLKILIDTQQELNKKNNALNLQIYNMKTAPLNDYLASLENLLLSTEKSKIQSSLLNFFIESHSKTNPKEKMLLIQVKELLKPKQGRPIDYNKAHQRLLMGYYYQLYRNSHINSNDSYIKVANKYKAYFGFNNENIINDTMNVIQKVKDAIKQARLDFTNTYTQNDPDFDSYFKHKEKE